MFYQTIIADSKGEKTTVEVSEKVYDVLQEAHKEEERYRNEFRRHRCDVDVACIGAMHHSGDAEMVAITNITLQKAYEIIQRCTPTQQRRFHRHRIAGYTLEEVAKQENCTKQSVQESIAQVDHKLHKLKNNWKAP